MKNVLFVAMLMLCCSFFLLSTIVLQAPLTFNSIIHKLGYTQDFDTVGNILMQPNDPGSGGGGEGTV